MNIGMNNMGNNEYFLVYNKRKYKSLKYFGIFKGCFWICAYRMIFIYLCWWEEMVGSEDKDY